ncbi:MAG: ABC transporter substrate-binding protein [Phycisphaerales bacterium]
MMRAVCSTTALAVAISLTGCGDPDAASSGRTKVAVQLNWVPEPEFGGFWQAQLDGHFDRAGLEVELLAGGPAVPAAQLVASGKVPFGVVSGGEMLAINDQGGELVAIFATFQGDPTAIMVHASSPWKTLEELWRSDATIACESNLPFVTYLNRRYGGERLKMVAHSPALANFLNDPMLAKQCFVFAEPVTLELQGVPTRVFPVLESGFNPYTAVIVTTRTYLDANPGICRAMVSALRRGWAAYLEDPAAANLAMSNLNPAMSLEAMNLAVEKQRFLVEDEVTKANAIGWMTVERWQTLAEQMTELGKLKAMPPAIGGAFWQPPVDASANGPGA